MRSWQRYTLTIVLGLAAGTVLAAYRVKGGLADNQITNGPWITAKTYGSTQADALTRARVALSGLLALPAKEAMYFIAKTDSAGQPLDGRCSYAVSGGPLPGRWWSVTLYEGEGWLVKNAANRWSLGSAAVPPDKWSFVVSPKPVEPLWLPTGGVPRFDLTLRVYHPEPDMLALPEAAKLPVIRSISC